MRGHDRALDAPASFETLLQAGADLAGLAFYELDYGGGTVVLRRPAARPARASGRAAAGPQAAGVLDGAPAPRRSSARAGHAADSCMAGMTGGSPRSTAICTRPGGRGGFTTSPASPRRDDAGRAIRTYGVLRDITERRQAEEELRQSYAEIERLKDRLQAESEYLKAEIRVVHAQGDVIGQSAVIRSGAAPGRAGRAHGFLRARSRARPAPARNSSPRPSTGSARAGAT